MIVRWLGHEETSRHGGFQIWRHRHWGTFADKAKYTTIPHKITNAKRTGNHGDGFEQSQNTWNDFLYCDYPINVTARFLNPNTFLRSWGDLANALKSRSPASDVHKQVCFSLSMREFFPRKQATLIGSHLPHSLPIYTLHLSLSLSL
jgi:hypothetical protein